MSLFAANSPTTKSVVVRAGSPAAARALIIAAVALGALGALASAGQGSTAETDTDLVGLLRFMAVLKAAMAAGLVGALWWRLAAPIELPRLVSYAATCGAMAAGPALIWTMSGIGLGALLLHAGLLAACLLLWRDPEVAARLSALVANRRL